MLSNKEIIRIKKCVVIFDDIERCKSDVSKLFGYINELVEHNEEKIVEEKDKHNEIKEKLIGLTIKYKLEN